MLGSTSRWSLWHDGGGGHIALAVDRDGAAMAQALQIAIPGSPPEVPSGEWNTWGISISCDKVMRSSSSSNVARTSPARGSVSQVSCPDTPAPACIRQTPAQIDFAARQLGFGRVSRRDADLDGDPGGQRPEAAKGWRPGSARTPRSPISAEHEAALRLAPGANSSSESLLLQQPQCLLHPQVQALARESATSWGRTQQRVAGESAQPVEGVAHGGLADKERFGGAGHAPCVIRASRSEQQIEVELVQFHGGIIRRCLWDNPSYSFDGWARNFLQLRPLLFFQGFRVDPGPPTTQGSLAMSIKTINSIPAADGFTMPAEYAPAGPSG